MAVVVPNIWEIPTPGTGDAAVLRITNRVLKGGLPDLNAARAERGLPPLTSLYDQVLGVERILVLSSETFDTVSAFVPANVRYVGPVLDDPAWTEPWSSPWPEDNTDPLVLVGFSSMYQDQGSLVQRVIDALSGMEVRAVVALGQMLEPARAHRAPNVAVVRSAPHSVLLREASVVVSHCGHGTTMKALAAGRADGLHPDGARPGRHGRPRGRSGSGRAALAARPRRPTSAPPSATCSTTTSTGANAARLGRSLASEHRPDDVVVEVGAPGRAWQARPGDRVKRVATDQERLRARPLQSLRDDRRSTRQLTPVDLNGGTVDVAGTLRAQPEHGRRHLVGDAEPSQRHLLGDALADVGVAAGTGD